MDFGQREIRHCVRRNVCRVLWHTPHRFQNLGWGRLTLDLSKTIARMRGAARLMLKVHPDNTIARTLYESAGFVQTGVDPRNQNLIYHIDLPAAHVPHA